MFRFFHLHPRPWSSTRLVGHKVAQNFPEIIFREICLIREWRFLANCETLTEAIEQFLTFSLTCSNSIQKFRNWRAFQWEFSNDISLTRGPTVDEISKEPTNSFGKNGAYRNCRDRRRCRLTNLHLVEGRSLPYNFTLGQLGALIGSL